MRSFRQREIAEPPGLPTHSDSHSLLHEIYTSHISHQSSVHPGGEVLFVEGETARGIYILSVLRNSSYETTVKTIE